MFICNVGFKRSEIVKICQFEPYFLINCPKTVKYYAYLWKKCLPKTYVFTLIGYNSSTTAVNGLRLMPLESPDIQLSFGIHIVWSEVVRREIWLTFAEWRHNLHTYEGKNFIFHKIARKNDFNQISLGLFCPQFWFSCPICY